ncbi:MAG TPA: aldo/keto reductase [Vicinamibacteria bacterium]|nr:aldo/keto reductase [Vicinamibacteria bacterium]
MAERRPLGRTSVEVTPIGLGCWQFSSGFGLVGGYWEALAQETVDEIVRAALAGGVDWFDTAEIYGRGRSEQALSRALAASGRRNGDVVIATKWWPLLRTARTIGATFDQRLRSLGGFSIDLHQVHQPFSFSSVEAEMDAMAALVSAKKVRAVGVSNFSAARMRRAHEALARHGIPLASNQVRYSLVDRGIETSGVLDAAKELGVTIIAYSPLGQGLLSGRFHDDPTLVRRRVGPRRYLPLFRARGLERTRPLVEELRRVAVGHGVTAAQVALNWLTHRHGETVVAIPGASRPHHAEEAAGAMKFVLSPDEIGRIDELSQSFR